MVFKSGIGIAIGLTAWILSGVGCAFYFMDKLDWGYSSLMDWNLWGIWVAENVFIFGL